MTTATEFLDAFNNSFVNKDSSYLDAIMAENCTIHFTGLHQTMTRRECQGESACMLGCWRMNLMGLYGPYRVSQGHSAVGAECHPTPMGYRI